MAKKKKKKSPAKTKPVAKKGKKAKRASSKEHERLWLMYPQKLVFRPVVYELGHKFAIVTNVRQAAVHDDVGLVCLELEGTRSEIDKAIKWLERIGVKVEPVELSVIAG